MSESDRVKGMFQQGKFWCVAGICIAPAFLLWLGIVASNNLLFCFEIECVKDSADWFSPVVTLLQIGMAALVLWTIAFRSDQAERQIRLQISVNTFRDYLAHRDDFFELIGSLETNEFIVDNRAKLYHQIFPQNSPQNFVPWADTKKSDDYNLIGMVWSYNQLAELVAGLRDENFLFDHLTTGEVRELLEQLKWVMECVHCQAKETVDIYRWFEGSIPMSGPIPVSPDKTIGFLIKLLEGLCRNSVDPRDPDKPLLLPFGVLGIDDVPRFKDIIENPIDRNTYE